MPLFDRIPSPPLEAVQWTGRNVAAIVQLGAKVDVTGANELRLWCGTDGAQGWVPVPLEHWIAKQSATDFYPIDPVYFTDHFTPAKEA